MSKKLRDEDLVLNIIVNGDRGKKEIGELERAIKDTNIELKSLEKQEKKLRAEGKKDTEQYRAVTAAIKQKNESLVLSTARLKQLKQGLDLNSMSLSDLRREMMRISRLRNIATPGTEEWKKHDAELKRVQARYQEVRGQSVQTGSTIQRMSTTASRAIGLVTAAIASMSAAIFGIRNATDRFAEFDDKVADVMKTTGLLKDQVLEINENLKSLDTRTTQEDLLALGRVAGKLGIDMQEDVEGFIRAADQIGVALSEDLGGDVEQAINDVGKLVDIFNVSDEFGIEEGLLKTGSAINELGAASTANEGYLVDFTKRLGGVAPAAGISMANILGLGATLDQFGQSVEVSGTAMSQLIVNMFSDTESYARIAGVEVSKFSDLLKTDANEALITLLQGVKGNEEGMQALVNNLEDLGIRGARAVQVISVLSNNTEALRTQQALANEAFEKGTSLSEEFAIKNETAAAQLEKAKRQVSNLVIELGERLFPIMTASNNLFSIFLTALIGIFDFIRDNWKLITTLAIAIGSYNAALLISTTYTKSYIALAKLKVFWDHAQRASVLLAAAAQAVFTGNLTRATAAMRMFNTVTRLNPVLLLVSAIAAAGTALYLYTGRLTAAQKAQKALLDVQTTAQKSIVEEKLELERLLTIARDKTRSDEERAAAVKALNEISPEFLGNLTLEKINTEEAKKATDAYINSLLKKAKVEAAQERLVEIAKQRIDMVKDATDLSFLENIQAAIVGRANVIGNKVAQAAKDLSEQEKALVKLINENTISPSPGSDQDRSGLPTAGPATPEETDAQRKAREKAEKEAEKAAKKAKEKRDKELAEQEKYRQKVMESQLSLIEQEKLNFQRRLEEAGIFGKDREALTEEELKVQEALEREHQANLNKIDADAMKEAIDRKQSNFQRELDLLRIQHNEEFKSIKTLEQAKAALEGELSKEALDGIRTMREARQELDKKFMREEEEFTRQHLQELKQILSDAIQSGDWQGIDLSDSILSEEEKKILEERLLEVKRILSELGLNSGTEVAEDKGLRRSSVDILGMGSDDWDTFFDNLENGRAGMEEITMATQALGSIWSQYNAFVAAGEQRKLQEFEASTRSKEALLKKQLDRGVIDQETYNKQVDKLNAELDRKKAVYERNQAKRERNVALMSAIVNTAAAVAKALPNLVLSAIVSAMGALQVATILRTPLPEVPGAESGGFLEDVVRSQDKKMFRAKKDLGKRGYVDRPTILAGEDGTEFVATNEAYKNPTIRPVLDAIDTAQRNGQISTINLNRILDQNRILASYPGRQRGGFIAERRTSPTPPPPVQADSDMKELIRQNNQLMADLRDELRLGIKAKVGLLGRDGFYEAEKDYNAIQNNVNL